MSEAAIAFCAFALMIAGPIFILAWFGSLSELDEKRRARQRQVNDQKSDALSVAKDATGASPSSAGVSTSSLEFVERSEQHGWRSSGVSMGCSALAAWVSEGRRLTRPILALCVTVASVLGVAGCGVPPEARAAVRPGMGTKDLRRFVGGPTTSDPMETSRSGNTAAISWM